MTCCVDLEFLDLPNTVDYVNFVSEIWIMYLFDQEGRLEVSAPVWESEARRADEYLQTSDTEMLA